MLQCKELVICNKILSFSLYCDSVMLSLCKALSKFVYLSPEYVNVASNFVRLGGSQKSRHSELIDFQNPIILLIARKLACGL